MTALLVIGLSLLTMRAFVNLWVWTPMRMIFGCALAMMFTTSEYWVNAIATDATRGRLVGLYATMFSLGWAVGPLLLGALGALSWTPVLVTAALLGLSMVPLLLMRNAAPVPPETAPGGLWQIVREAPAAALAPFVYGAVEIGVFALLPVYALHQGLSPAEGAAMLAALSAGNVALQYPIGWLADRMDRSLILILCALSGVLGALSLPFVIHAPILLYSTLFLWGGVVVGLYTMGLVLLGAKFSGPRLATANSAVMILYSAGGLVAPLFSGVAMDLLPPHGLAWVMGLLCGGYALFAVKDLTRAASSLGSRPSE
jgi:MFS family permease